MADETLPLSVGIVACIVVLASLLAPYLLLSGPETSGLGVYYESGLVGVWLAALFTVVLVVVFASGRQGRTDPETVAGAGLVVGIFVVVLALQWALAVDQSVVLQLGQATWLAWHRWAVVVLTLPLPVAGAWYARLLGLL